MTGVVWALRVYHWFLNEDKIFGKLYKIMSIPQV